MEILPFALDLIIVLTILLLAWQTLFRPSLFAAVVFFISFSLVVSLAWVRLEAPDVALAEAAIGAGLGGALFLATVRRLDKKRPPRDVEESGHAGE